MPCPHFRKSDNECDLLDNVRADPDEDLAPQEPERLLLEYCLGSRREWRECAVFRRCVVESKVAF